MAGYCFTQLGKIQLAKGQFKKAEKSFDNALNNLNVRGEYSQDIAASYRGLTKVYTNLHDVKKAKEHLVRTINVYDALAMFKELRTLDEEFSMLNTKVEDYLPVHETKENGEPKKCRECGNEQFNMVEEKIDRKVFECKSCNWRNVVLKQEKTITA